MAISAHYERNILYAESGLVKSHNKLDKVLCENLLPVGDPLQMRHGSLEEAIWPLWRTADLEDLSPFYLGTLQGKFGEATEKTWEIWYYAIRSP